MDSLVPPEEWEEIITQTKGGRKAFIEKRGEKYYSLCIENEWKFSHGLWATVLKYLEAN